MIQPNTYEWYDNNLVWISTNTTRQRFYYDYDNVWITSNPTISGSHNTTNWTYYGKPVDTNPGLGVKDYEVNSWGYYLVKPRLSNYVAANMVDLYMYPDGSWYGLEDDFTYIE